ENLELLIVDDGSDDDGVNVVRHWLDSHALRFVDARLLSHSCNSGLAAARNSAFSAARSDWCFVLDADNLLERNAVKNCLKV
ncbi:glycosyltransferase, partial [Klebsiella aerogenes]|uniref:glycosyltransferase n=1 Tax=Klebsiella aerogenes TaxID=548 RepID=UPI001CC59A01